MLYRDVVEIPDMLYFDATGSLFDDVNEFNRILCYFLTTRHPFGSTPPVPLFEFVSSEHTVGAIQRGLQDLRCYERVVHDNVKVPLIMMCDYSSAIISACFRIFNNQTRIEYLDVLYEGIVEKSRELTLENIMVVFVCLAHITKTAGRNIDRLMQRGKVGTDTEDKKCIRKLAMRVVGLIANCETFKDIEKIVTNALVVFNSPICSNQLEGSLKYLEDAINTFQFPVEQEKQQQDDEILQSQEEENLQNTRNVSKFQSYFERIAESLKIPDADGNTQNVDKNRFFFPEFSSYLIKELLSSVPLWSGFLRPIIIKSDDDRLKLLEKE